MKNFTRARLTIAGALLAALSFSTVGVAAVSTDAAPAVKSLRGTDHWPY